MKEGNDGWRQVRRDHHRGGGWRADLRQLPARGARKCSSSNTASSSEAISRGYAARGSSSTAAASPPNRRHPLPHSSGTRPVRSRPSGTRRWRWATPDCDVACGTSTRSGRTSSITSRNRPPASTSGSTSSARLQRNEGLMGATLSPCCHRALEKYRLMAKMSKVGLPCPTDARDPADRAARRACSSSTTRAWPSSSASSATPTCFSSCTFPSGTASSTTTGTPRAA